MRNRIEIWLMLSLSLVVALVAAAMIFPGHPRLEDPAATAEVEATPAVFAHGVHAAPGVLQSPAAQHSERGDASSECPYLSMLNASSACPKLERSDSAEACPYLAVKQKAAGCPGMQDQQGAGAEACPYAGTQEQPSAPHGKTKAPNGPHA
jgi:hypothetical protein